MQKAPITKYRPFQQIPLENRQWPNRVIQHAPVWCSVDLRDGNQALAIPMGIREKLEFFELLTRIGFKEIEVGFPSASDTEFSLTRELIEKKLIPDDVTIQVLVQCREHLIRRTYEALKGARRAIVHFYNSTNPLQRRVTFNMSKEEIKKVAVEGARLAKSMEKESGDTEICYEYSPESFSDTEVDYAVEVCQAVMDVIQPTSQKKMIINLPETVQLATPNVYADQIEYFCRNIKNRDSILVSLHTHNDRGTGIAASELGVMAGADRVEGTLFGNGERTGNVDIMTLAMNLYAQGIDPQLDFSDIESVREVYERCTRMSVHPRHPYAGDLVFTAFSGSHQDAIKKGMDAMEKNKANVPEGTEQLWQVPYLPIDPQDIGRSYEAIIRINSQSGKGGVAFIMERDFGFVLPKAMHPEFGNVITAHADTAGAELPPDRIKAIFDKEYLNRILPLELIDCDMKPCKPQGMVEASAKVRYKGEERQITGVGNGPINALVNAIEHAGWKQFRVQDYSQHALTSGSAAEAASYIRVERTSDKKSFWGVAVDANIEMAGLKALVCAINRASVSK